MNSKVSGNTPDKILSPSPKEKAYDANVGAAILN